MNIIITLNINIHISKESITEIASCGCMLVSIIVARPGGHVSESPAREILF